MDKARNPDREHGSTYRVWGLKRRSESCDVFSPERHPSVARVMGHLGLQQIEVRNDGEPMQVALGELPDDVDPDAVSRRITPFFSSLDSLDFFCRLNLRAYLSIDPHDGLPRRWFWQESVRGAAPVPGWGAQGLGAQEASIRLPA